MMIMSPSPQVQAPEKRRYRRNMLRRRNRGQVLAPRVHCVHTAHAEAGILTQEHLSPVR